MTLLCDNVPCNQKRLCTAGSASARHRINVIIMDHMVVHEFCHIILSTSCLLGKPLDFYPFLQFDPIHSNFSDISPAGQTEIDFPGRHQGLDFGHPFWNSLRVQNLKPKSSEMMFNLQPRFNSRLAPFAPLFLTSKHLF